MKLHRFLGILSLGAACAFGSVLRAQIVELRATLTAAQEVPATSSAASGSAIMLYDVGANTFDLIISIRDMSNPATASHIHEAIAGTNGSVVTNLGGEAVYTRAGNSLIATFRSIRHGGDKLKLLQGGAYFNIHSAQFPGGEIRGQLAARPVRLVANLDVAQEQAAFPAVNLSAAINTGGAVMLYDPAANTISIRTSIYNYNSTFTNSHIHEGAPGVSGPVRTSLGTSATAGAYNSNSGHISGAHDIPYVGDPLLLLTGGMYLNFHSSAFPGGQLRGQISVSNETPSTRFGNLAVRGFVGPGDQVLIQGISVTGPEPIRALISAKGPSLASFGVTGAIANPRLGLYDSAGREIAASDDVGPIVAGTELASIPGVPRNSLESALVVVLPPGNYTAMVTSASGSGIALLEVSDLRSLLRATPVLTSGDGNSAARAATAAAPELCAAVPLAPATR